MRFKSLATLAPAMALVAFAVPALAQCTFTSSGSVMYLDGDCTVTNSGITIPDGWTLDGQGHTITAVESGPGLWNGPVVQNAQPAQAPGSAGVRSLRIEVQGLACACKGGDDRLAGIKFTSANGFILNNEVLGVNKFGNAGCGCQEGLAIWVQNPPFDATHPGTVAVTVQDNVAHDYQKGGIVVNGDVSTVVKKNDVEGPDMVDFIASNGIQLGYGAHGSVEDNVSDGNWYTGASWTASGVLLFETSSVKVKKNTVLDNQSGIVAEAWHWSAPAASDNEIVDNRVVNSDWGIIADAFAWTFSNGNPEASRNVIKNNRLTGSGNAGSVGITVGGYDSSALYDPTSEDNVVKGNTIKDFETAIQDDQTGFAPLVGQAGSRLRSGAESQRAGAAPGAAGGQAPGKVAPFEP